MNLEDIFNTFAAFIKQRYSWHSLRYIIDCCDTSIDLCAFFREITPDICNYLLVLYHCNYLCALGKKGHTGGLSTVNEWSVANEDHLKAFKIKDNITIIFYVNFHVNKWPRWWKSPLFAFVNCLLRSNEHRVTIIKKNISSKSVKLASPAKTEWTLRTPELFKPQYQAHNEASNCLQY